MLLLVGKRSASSHQHAGQKSSSSRRGPAGLEVARVASLRGHKVTIYEKGDKLGGQLLLAAAPPHKEDIGNLTRFLTGQMTKLGIEVHLRETVTPSLVLRVKPEAVVVATGSSPVTPGIPGVDQQNVVMARDVLSNKKDVGDKVVIIGGGGLAVRQRSSWRPRVRRSASSGQWVPAL